MSLLAAAPLAMAQEQSERLDSVVVKASRAGENTPVPFTSVSKEQLRSSNPINSLPMALALHPGVVVSNEGGTGIGYSKMTVRGSKGSQINVTLNGITLNDAESQEVFWVNIPALTSVISSVQVQRGLGTTANGAGAFGASINMSTGGVHQNPSATISTSVGSFATGILTANASTGVLPSGLYLDFAWSVNTTDGYIRNAWGNTTSLYGVIGWMNGSNSLKLTYLRGDQRTGITWTGIPYSYLQTDRTYNPEGIYTDDGGNTCYYGNHTDNYAQQHLQLNYTRQIAGALTWSTTLNWTDGYGFNERYKTGKKLKAYGFPSDFAQASSKGDVIFRKTMANDLLVLSSSLSYGRGPLRTTGGIYVSYYRGDHYGELLWSKVLGKAYDYASLNAPDPGNNWYFNQGRKWDANAYARAEYTWRWLTLYADFQYRLVTLDMNGIDDEDDLPMGSAYRWNFFNPHAGASARFGSHRIYASAALGGREPGRSDIKEIIESNNLEGGNRQLKPERMLDIEAGYGFDGKWLDAGANIYLMEYRDMLLETGELSASGYAIKDNVPRSYRRGVEIYAGVKAGKYFSARGNISLSTNKILDYTQYWEEYDNPDDWNFVGQYSEHFDKVDMLLSPSLTAAAFAQVHPFAFAKNSLRTTALSAEWKYVGSQYWDNTASADRRIPAYSWLDLSLTHEFALGEGRLGIGAYVKNVLGSLYYADAWVYRAHFASDGSWYQEEGVFPQPPTNWLFKIFYNF